MSDPTNLTEATSYRTTAITRHIAALQELRDSYTDLAAIDRALANAALASPLPTVPAEALEAVPGVLQHPSARGPSGRWEPLIQTRIKQLLAGMGFSA